MNQNYSKIPCFVEKNPKTTIENCDISKQNLWFSIASIYNSFHFSFQNFVFKKSPCFLELSPFEQPQSLQHDKNEQEFKIQTNKVL
jgi:hypothetical protein